jgi:hypothetical protein
MSFLEAVNKQVISWQEISIEGAELAEIVRLRIDIDPCLPDYDIKMVNELLRVRPDSAYWSVALYINDNLYTHQGFLECSRESAKKWVINELKDYLAGVDEKFSQFLTTDDPKV